MPWDDNSIGNKLTELRLAAAKNSSLAGTVKVNKRDQEKYAQESKQFEQNIEQQQTNIKNYNSSILEFKKTAARNKGLKDAIVRSNNSNITSLKNLYDNIQAESDKKSTIKATQSEILSINLKNKEISNKRFQLRAKITNLNNIKLSDLGDGLSTEQKKELLGYEQEMQDHKVTLKINRDSIKNKNAEITKTEAFIESLDNPYFQKAKILNLERKIANEAGTIKNFENFLAGHETSIEKLTAQKEASEKDITATQRKINGNVTRLTNLGGKVEGYELRLLNESAQNGLGHLFNKAENAELMAKFMFSSTSDMINNLTADGANKEMMAKALKDQAAKAIKKSVIGQYIESELTKSRGKSCEEVTQCMNLQQLGISQSSLIKATPGSEAGPLPGKKPASLQEAE
jgi:hypothetical protein